MPRPTHFVDLSDHVPDARIALRYATHDNFTGAPLPGYGPIAWLDAEFAARVARAATTFRARGLYLWVFDAYRPVRAANAMAEWAHQTDNAWLLDGYISTTSRHCRGIAIDVTLCDADGTCLDMGTDFDAFGPPGHTRNAVGAALDNRLLLREGMMAAGLEDYRREWWHFDAPDLKRPLLDEPISPR